MKFFIVSFWLSLKQKWSKTTFLVFFLLISCILALGIFTARSEKESLWEFKAGIAYDFEDEFSIQAVSFLEEKINLTHFNLNAISLEELQKNLPQESFKVLYVFPPNFKERVTMGRLEDLITTYSMPGDPFGTVMDKWMFASVLTTGAPYITAHQLSYTLKQPYKDMEPYIKNSFDKYHEDGNFVTWETTWVGRETANRSETNMSSQWIRQMSGMVALLVFVWVCVTLGNQIHEKRQVELSLQKDTRVIYQFSNFFSVFVSGFILGAIPLFSLLSWYTDYFPSPQVLLSLCGYVLCLTGITSLLSQLLPSTEGLLPFGIFSFLFVLAFGGIFFNPREIAPILEAIGKFFPSTYFIESISNHSMDLLFPLFIVGFTTLLISLVCAYPHPNRR